MSAIQQALSKLDNAVAKAESAAQGISAAAHGQQRDMFATPATPPSNSNVGSKIDNALVAEKLNSTIEKMEKLLETA